MLALNDDLYSLIVHHDHFAQVQDFWKKVYSVQSR